MHLGEINKPGLQHGISCDTTIYRALAPTLTNLQQPDRGEGQ